jgi:DNA-binding NarL/FixJ family response regulator
MIAQGLRAALAGVEDMEVVGVCPTLAEAEQVARGSGPDVVVMDFRLPDGDAPDGIPRIQAAAPGARVLVVSALSDYRSVIRALEAGAAGYLLKDQPLDDLVAGIRMVRAGERALAPTLIPTLLERITPTARPAAQLSRREIEVLQLLADGCATNEIATRLHVSVNTVRNHVQSVLNRLGAHSKLEAVSIGLREGVIQSPDRGRPSR